MTEQQHDTQHESHPQGQPQGQPTYQHPYPYPRPRRLVRDTDDKILGGVCSGAAQYLGLDPTLVRVLAVLGAVLGAGSLVLAYVVAWVLVPAADRS